MHYSKFRKANRRVMMNHARKLFGLELDSTIPSKEMRALIYKEYDERGLQMEGRPSPEQQAEADRTIGEWVPPTEEEEKAEARASSPDPDRGLVDIAEVITEAPEAPRAPRASTVIRGPVNWQDACYGLHERDDNPEAGPIQPVPRAGQLERRIRLTIHPAKDEPDYITIGVNGRIIQVMREMEVDIAQPYFDALDLINVNTDVTINGVLKERLEKRFNYTIHGAIWWRDGKPVSPLEPFIAA